MPNTDGLTPFTDGEQTDASLVIPGMSLTGGVGLLSAEWTDPANPYIVGVQFEYYVSGGPKIRTEPQNPKTPFKWNTSDGLDAGGTYLVRYRARGLANWGPWSHVEGSGVSVAVTSGARESMVVACSDMTSPLSVAADVQSFFAPYDGTLEEVFTGIDVRSSSGVVTVDVKKNGTTIFTTKPSIGATPARTSLSGTGSVAAALSVTTWDKGDWITINVDAAGTGAAGLKTIFIWSRR